MAKRLSQSINLIDEDKLKSICEFLFVDQFNDFADYDRFEKCLQPLFNDTDLYFPTIFKEICGEKKKYLNHQRLAKCYAKFLTEPEKLSEHTKKFFELLFNNIFQSEGFIGEKKEKCYNYSTLVSNKGRKCITKIQIFNNINNNIYGMQIIYDEIFKSKMFPSKFENDLILCLDINLNYFEEEIKKYKTKIDASNQYQFRDGVTHIFGTFCDETKLINFLGFKCVSGKTVFVGFPKGKGFLYGQFGYRLHDIELQMNDEGICMLTPFFNFPNPRKNYFIDQGSLHAIFNEDDKNIYEESKLENLKDQNEIDQIISTSLIDSTLFVDKKMLDETKGNDYKEVVKSVNRSWLLGKSKTIVPKKNEIKIDSLEDIMKLYDKEYKLRSSSKYFSDQKKQPEKLNKSLMVLHSFKTILEPSKFYRRDNVINNEENQKQWNGDIRKSTYKNFLNNIANYNLLKTELGNAINDTIQKNNNNEEKNNKEDNNNKKNNRCELLNIMAKVWEDDQKAKKSMENKNEIFYNEKIDYVETPKLKGWQKKIPGKIFNKIDEPEKNKKIISYVDDEKKINEEKIIKKKKNRKLKIAQQNWKFFANGLTNMKIVYILQTIRSIMQAIKAYNNKNLDVNEKIKIYHSLEKNQKIVEFLTSQSKKKNPLAKKKKKKKKKKKVIKKEDHEDEYEIIQEGSNDDSKKNNSNKSKGETSSKKTKDPKKQKKLIKKTHFDEVEISNNYNEKSEDELEYNKKYSKYREEDILLPDTNPEDFTTLEEINENLKKLDEILANPSLTPEIKEKAYKLRQLYFLQRNIIIENNQETIKKSLISKLDIDVDSYYSEENKKREKALKIQNELFKSLIKPSMKNYPSISIASIKEPSKIFNNQEFYKGEKPFTDPLFLPEKNSLCPYDEEGWLLPDQTWESDVEGWENYQWCRVEEILGNNYNIFENGTNREDIMQGSLGDCYFLSVISSLCSYKKLIQKLFYTKNKTNEHLFGIYIFINGCWELVLIDDYLPCTGDYFKQLTFSSNSNETELWVAILEKVWAKINGCYARIVGGQPNEVYDVLTEAFSEIQIITKFNKDLIWDKMKKYQSLNFCMTAGTSGDSMNEEVGLSPGHAYTIYGIEEFNHNGENVRLIKLRNPWGSGEYNGDWSDSSSLWTPELRKKYNSIEKNDGIFFISLEDFVNYYVTLSVAKIHEDYSSQVVIFKREQATKCQFIKVKINNDKEKVYFQLYQKNPRIRLKDNTYQKTTLSYILLVDNKMNFINASCSNNQHICVEEILNKGEYYLICDVNYRYDEINNKNIHGYAVTAYSLNPVILENITESFDIKNFEKVIFNYCKKKAMTRRDPSGVKVYIYQNFIEEVPFMLVGFENETNNNYEVNLEIIKQGKKSFCIYNDKNANEEDEETIKKIPANSNVCVTIMRYTLSSLFGISYQINKCKNEGKKNNKNIQEEKKENDDNYNDDNSDKKNKKSKKSDYDNEVFLEEGDPIDDRGKLVQYYLKKKNGYLIGFENKSKKIGKFKLILEGLTFKDIKNKKNNGRFEIGPNERKVFDTVLKKKYHGQISFFFDNQ